MSGPDFRLNQRFQPFKINLVGFRQFPREKGLVGSVFLPCLLQCIPEGFALKIVFLFLRLHAPCNHLDFGKGSYVHILFPLRENRLCIGRLNARIKISHTAPPVRLSAFFGSSFSIVP